MDIFHKHINWHKITTRGRINILRPDFESSRRILSRYEFIDAKFYVFMPFCNQNGISVSLYEMAGSDAGYRLGYKKASKYKNEIRNGKYGV